MDIFLFILLHNIIPIFFIIFLGYICGKKFDLNIFTLSKLNFYIFVPTFVFMQMYTTKIPDNTIKIFTYAITLMIINFCVSTSIARIKKYEFNFKSAFVNSVMFYNSGNIGIPLITLIFSSKPFIINGATPYLDIAITAQIMVFFVQSLTTNTIGFFNAGRGNMDWKESLKNVFTMPAIYAILISIILKNMPYNMEESIIWPALLYLKAGMIPIALIALGVQLSKTSINLKCKDVYLSNTLRLIGGPVLAYLIIRTLGITGIVAQTLLISSSVPTAVNTALIAVEMNCEPEYASQVVMSSTLLSSITIVLTVYVSRLIFPIPL